MDSAIRILASIIAGPILLARIGFIWYPVVRKVNPPDTGSWNPKLSQFLRFLFFVRWHVLNLFPLFAGE